MFTKADSVYAADQKQQILRAAAICSARIGLQNRRLLCIIDGESLKWKEDVVSLLLAIAV